MRLRTWLMIGLLLMTAACRAASEYPPIARVESQALIQESNGVVAYNGGYGSALAVVRGRPGVFYLLTDRGPNVDTDTADQKRFLVPSFSPQIGVFELADTMLARVGVIEMKDASGSRFTGIPNPTDHRESVESAVDREGKPLPLQANGLDPEGLAALEDGTFWVSDEYGPYVLHLDASGREIERLSPFGANSRGRSLPAVLGRRRMNYGMEGLAVTPDGSTLIGIMQSALDNPSRDVRATTRTTRLVAFNLASGTARQFVYLREAPDFSVTDITAVSGSVFVLLERDDNFPGARTEPGRHKRAYRIDISSATDISDSANAPSGKSFNGKTVEQLTESELTAAGIKPVERTLAVDLLSLPGGYPHDKPEGLAFVTDRLLAVANDDDFGISGDDRGELIQKTNPATGSRDQNQVYFIRLGEAVLRP